VALVIDLDPSDTRTVQQCSNELMEISRKLDRYAEGDFEKRGKAEERGWRKTIGRD